MDPVGFCPWLLRAQRFADLLYKVTEYYALEWDRVLRWDDPDLAIDWPLLWSDHPLLSARDGRGISLVEAVLFD
jgi:dTDP-4-dehydrorhamnose 3,5-epimerase